MSSHPPPHPPVQFTDLGDDCHHLVHCIIAKIMRRGVRRLAVRRDLQFDAPLVPAVDLHAGRLADDDEVRAHCFRSCLEGDDGALDGGNRHSAHRAGFAGLGQQRGQHAAAAEAGPPPLSARGRADRRERHPASGGGIARRPPRPGQRPRPRPHLPDPAGLVPAPARAAAGRGDDAHGHAEGDAEGEPIVAEARADVVVRPAAPLESRSRLLTLEAGETVVVEGVQKVRTGVRVAPTQAAAEGAAQPKAPPPAPAKSGKE